MQFSISIHLKRAARIVAISCAMIAAVSVAEPFAFVPAISEARSEWLAIAFLSVLFFLSGYALEFMVFGRDDGEEQISLNNIMPPVEMDEWDAASLVAHSLIRIGKRMSLKTNASSVRVESRDVALTLARAAAQSMAVSRGPADVNHEDWGRTEGMAALLKTVAETGADIEGAKDTARRVSFLLQRAEIGS